MYLFRCSVVNLVCLTNINYTLKAIDTLMTRLGVRRVGETSVYIQFSTEKINFSKTCFNYIIF